MIICVQVHEANPREGSKVLKVCFGRSGLLKPLIGIEEGGLVAESIVLFEGMLRQRFRSGRFSCFGQIQKNKLHRHRPHTAAAVGVFFIDLLADQYLAPKLRPASRHAMGDKGRQGETKQSDLSPEPWETRRDERRQSKVISAQHPDVAWETRGTRRDKAQ